MKLYTDEEKNNVIDFTGDLSFSKNEFGVEIDKKFKGGFKFVGKLTYFIGHKKTKLSKFIYAAKILWRWI